MLAAVVLPTSAFAGTALVVESAAPEIIETERDWWVSLSPYTWLTAVEGDAGLAGFVSPVDISIADTLEDLDMVFMLTGEAGYGKWSFGLDTIYAKVSQSLSFPRLSGAGGKFSQKQLILTPRIAYKVVSTDSYSMDVLTGARWMFLDYDLTLSAPAGKINRGMNEDWIDPIFGVRGGWQFSEKTSLSYYGDVGGFGISSDLTWQAYVGLGYKFTPSVSGVVGFRGLGYDYQDDGFTLDTVTYGPVLGLEISF